LTARLARATHCGLPEDAPMNLAGLTLVVAIVSAIAGLGTAAALEVHERADSVQTLQPTRSLAGTCMRSAAVAVARR
jgi:hypothetical protein